MSKAKKQILTIVGLGVMGGSLGAALRKRSRMVRVIGLSRSRSKIALAKRRGYIHDGTTELKAAVSGADVIVICTPVDTIINLISKIDRIAKRGAVVTDVGSVKFKMVNWAAGHTFQNIHFIGSHPLTGSHLTGVGHSRHDLYEGATVFVTPHRRSNRDALRRVGRLWRSLKSRVIELDAYEHDRMVSFISHVPHAVAASLVNATPERSVKHASSGFRDTTRIAMGEQDIWLPIFLDNRANLLRGLRGFERSLHSLMTSLMRSDKKKLKRFLTNAAHLRRQID
jgi:prephenate dehydrogenase